MQANAKFGSPEFSSPPSASNARTPAVTLPAFDQPAEASMPTPPSQHANVHADAPVEIGAAAQSQAGPSNLQKEMLANWSPNKLASLQFFLKSDKAVAAAAPSVAPEPARPYLGLKYLLSAGPNGMNNPDVGLGGAMGSAAVAAGNAVPAPTSHALPPRPLATSNRFNPYRRPE